MRTCKICGAELALDGKCEYRDEHEELIGADAPESDEEDEDESDDD